MDIASFFSKADEKILLAITVGSSIGAVAGIFKDTDDLAKTYINLCQGIVYGGISGPIIYNNTIVQSAIIMSMLVYGFNSIDNYFDKTEHYLHNKGHKKHKSNKMMGPFFDHY